MRVYRLENSQGMVVSFIALGGIITAIEVPDRAGNPANVVLGLPQLEDYRNQRVYFGCITGRYANRIANASFALDGRTYQLAATDGTSSVHGGRRGFDKAEWQVSQDGSAGALLRHQSPDLDEGYPGTLDVSVRYSLSELNELRFDYHAVTDKPTVVNLTNHSYFNLKGAGKTDILTHRLQVNANRYTPADSILIPTGRIASVEGTPFDFRKPRPIGERIATPHPQILAGKGYDLNYVIDREVPGTLVLAARLSEPVSGRIMDVETTEPGLQVYTGNLLDGTIEGHSGQFYRQYAGICLETHHYPDSPNQPSFPSVVLRPGETYRSTTIYRFGVMAAN